MGIRRPINTSQELGGRVVPTRSTLRSRGRAPNARALRDGAGVEWFVSQTAPPPGGAEVSSDLLWSSALVGFRRGLMFVLFTALADLGPPGTGVEEECHPLGSAWTVSQHRDTDEASALNNGDGVRRGTIGGGHAGGIRDGPRAASHGHGAGGDGGTDGPIGDTRDGHVIAWPNHDAAGGGDLARAADGASDGSADHYKKSRLV
jgi:hypothetical protein